MRFDGDYDESRRADIIARFAQLVDDYAAGAPASYTQVFAELMRTLLIDAMDMLVNDPQMSAADREYSRSLVNGVPVAAEYRHELLMSIDQDYRNTWLWDHVVDFQTANVDNDLTLQSIVRGRSNHSYFENDPDIADRSIYRAGWRELREGEEPPPPVLGKFAPAVTLTISPILRTHYVQPVMS